MAQTTLGFFENFPENVHKKALFAASISSKKLQQMLIQMFSETNGKTFNLEDVADPSVPQCKVIFEFGIAEANNFNYLDKEETTRVLEAVQKKPLKVMDFYCAIRYYKTQNDKKTPLKFDYYMIRLIFNKNSMAAQVFHERGPRYVAPEDITNKICNEINKRSSKKILKTLETP